MQVQAIQTDIYKPAMNLLDFILESCDGKLKERSILAVTSKVVSLSENRFVPMESIDKLSLAKQESDLFLGEIGYGCFLTIKEGLLIPSAGIDESNSESGDYILYPKKPFESARNLNQKIKKALGLKEFGILLTDSHTLPLRRGVSGIALSYDGFKGVKSLVGSKDLFGRELKMTQMDLADGLAAASVLVMGEGSDRRPLALIEDVDVEFTDQPVGDELRIPREEDLYAPLYEPLMNS